MSKMGISTLQSYCGAQLWEAVGLNAALVDRHFAGTPSRVGGIGMDLIAEETLRRHAQAFEDESAVTRLDPGGEYQYRVQGEHHNWNPMTIAKLQHATRGDSYSTFKEFSPLANDETRRQSTLRGLLDFVERDPIPLDEVEPASAITRRFCTGAMSFGSLSTEAHETLAIAMNRLGGRSNSGEGGEDPDALRHRAQQRDQAGRVGALRRYGRVPGQRDGAADQDLAGREARRRRPAPRAQGGCDHREDAALDARSDAHLASAAPRHLLDRRSGAAHLRPQSDLPNRSGIGEAGGRGGSGDCRCGRGKGARGSDSHLGRLGRHGRFAALEYHARRESVGAGARRDAADARDQRSARACAIADGRPAQDRT